MGRYRNLCGECVAETPAVDSWVSRISTREHELRAAVHSFQNPANATRFASLGCMQIGCFPSLARVVLSFQGAVVAEWRCWAWIF